MRSWLAILVTVVALGGVIACNDHGAETLTAIKLKVCACKTASCAEQEIKQVPQTSIDSNHRTQTIARDMLECLAKLHAAEQPSTDPDAERDEGEPAATKTTPSVLAPASQAAPAAKP